MAQKASEPRGQVYQTSTRSNEKYCRRTRRLAMQKSILVCLDPNISSANHELQDAWQQLRGVVNNIYLFSDPDECVDFLTNVKMEQIFLVSDEKLPDEQWTKALPKVQGVYRDIESISQALQMGAKRCNPQPIAVSFSRSNGEDNATVDLNQLESSFMYTQLFKNVLLDMPYDERAVQDLVKYYTEKHADNPNALTLVEEFGREYRPEKAIWWYTRPIFIYGMVNRALRLLEAGIIVNMGFFICDLHRQIQQLHAQQISEYDGQPLVVYRGQGLSISDFQKLQRIQGGLMSFNGFLSTSHDREVSTMFAQSASMDVSQVGILFVMNIDTKITSYPFAEIQHESYFGTEQEILFSTHTVFRIGDIGTLNGNGRLFEVQLNLTNDDDPQLRILTTRLEKDQLSNTGWNRIGRLLMQVGELGKAEELYHNLLEQEIEPDRAGLYCHQLGSIKCAQGDYKEAVRFYEKALDAFQSSPSANHHQISICHNNLGVVYSEIGEHSKALSLYEKAVEIDQTALPPNHPWFAKCYNNIGLVYSAIGEYAKSHSFLERALNINQNDLPENHPELANSYNSMGTVCSNMGDYSRALFFNEKAMDIRKKSLPENHSSIVTSFNNSGVVYAQMGEYSKAISLHKKAVAIYQANPSPNQLTLGNSYCNIGEVYLYLGEPSNAISFFERALAIKKETLSANHPDVAICYNNLAAVYAERAEYSNALCFSEKALDIHNKAFPANHASLATTYSRIATAHVIDCGRFVTQLHRIGNTVWRITAPKCE